MSAELNACPFCKSSDVAVETESNGAMPGSQYNYAFVACRQCGARGPRFDDWGNAGYRQQAAEAWKKISRQIEIADDAASDDPRNSGLASKARSYDVWVWNMDDNLFYRETDVDKKDGHIRPPGIPVHSSNYR
jgi:hypothetical protein